MNKISPARVAAFEILKRIAKEKAFSSVLLPTYEENLTPVDRALCHELVLGILRKQIFLDKLIEKLTKKNSEKFDLEVILALRLGIYQLLFLDKIPAYSAINESVNLVHKAKKRSATGLVNAVLRKVSRKENLDLKFSNEIERISVETSHPRWLIEKWIGQFGIERTAEIAVANNETPNSTFRFTAKFYQSSEQRQREVSGLISELELRKSEIVEDCFIVEKSSEKLRELAEKGFIYFQEEGSQLVGKVVDLQQDESFFDVCAAPGSKTTFVGSKLKVQNSKLFVAGDLYEQRLKFLRDNCLNQGVDFARFLQYDAEKSLPFADESFDMVLIDAPCSGTGTIRHNPEIRYFLQEKDFGELSDKQLKILQNASKVTRRGGRLIYSTCSLETQENEEVVEKFLTANSEFKKALPEIDEKLLTGRGFARTFPNRDKIDGFFISVFERK